MNSPDGSSEEDYRNKSSSDSGRDLWGGRGDNQNGIGDGIKLKAMVTAGWRSEEPE